jgi:membrane protein implicated in regulation of membrane protease activity
VAALLWLLATGVLFVIEMVTANLLFASLAISAGAAMITAWAGGDFLAQGFAFGISAGVTIFLLRPLALREIAKRSPKTATNTDALIGVGARTLVDTTEETGRVKLKGEVWSARSQSGDIPAGSSVTVVAIDGAEAIVSRVRPAPSIPTQP